MKWDDVSSVTGKYWLWRDDRQQWEEVSRDEYMAAERAAGFNAPAGRVSTAAFANGPIRGTTILPRRAVRIPTESRSAMKWPWRRPPGCVDCGWRFGRRGRMHEAGCRVLEAQVDIREQELRRRIAQIEAAKAREVRCPSRARAENNIWKYCIRVDGHPDTELHIWVESFAVVGRRPIVMTWEGSFSTTPTISTVLVGVAPIPRHTPGEESGHHN